MSKPNQIRNHIIAALASTIASLALAGTAEAVDLRDWGRKYPTSERFVVLAQFNNQAVLDKETQLVWQRWPSATTDTFMVALNSCLFLELGGRLGWRLPFGEELRSLIDPSVSNATSPALPTGHPFIGLLAPTQARYWTLSKDPTLDRRLSLGLYKTGGDWAQLDSKRGYWCVRGHTSGAN